VITVYSMSPHDPQKLATSLVSTEFAGSYTRGFAAIGEPEIAVCLLPGTELAFAKNGRYKPAFHHFTSSERQRIVEKVASFSG